MWSGIFSLAVGTMDCESCERKKQHLQGLWSAPKKPSTTSLLISSFHQDEGLDSVEIYRLCYVSPIKIKDTLACS